MDNYKNQLSFLTKSRNALKNHSLIISVCGLTALAGIISGALFAYSPDLTVISELDDYTPGTITRIYASGGELIGEFATERRVIINYDDIPEVMRNAIIAAEDASFFRHVGFNIPRILVTFARNILTGDLTGAGASTLTMQLARNVTLGGERLGLQKTWRRKLQEAYYTFHIEKRYTKREILALYSNQMYLGTRRHSAHGVEAASQLYFGKSVKELELQEAALIAGIFQSPARQSPLVNPDLARRRRNYVLQQMLDEKYINQAEAEAAKNMPIKLAQRTPRTNLIAPHFIEEIRQRLERTYGAQKLYEEGLVVHSTLDAKLQTAANRAVQKGLRALDKRIGFRSVTRNVFDEGATLENFEHSRWRLDMNTGDIVPAIVTKVEHRTIGVQFGRYQSTIDSDGFKWTGHSSTEQLVKPGALVEVRIDALDKETGIAEASLDQEPKVEAALLALDNRTGSVLAMVGGYDFNRSKFNRATQAYRQLGSLFKGILYAAAVDQGYTTTSIVQDHPVSYDVGPDQDPYEPTNYDDEYEGPITIRRALEKSRNVPAVWLMNELGPETVVGFARRLGFESPIPPFLSVALGSAESTLQEVTSAYSAFPNRGIRMVPYQIERILDREGVLLEEGQPQPQDALRSDTAYIMVSLMRGVVQRGTGVGARQLEWPVGGKTGTMDDYTDAWFVGFDPNITVGVWVGHDEKVTLGEGEEGASVALPIWRDFMKAYIDEHKNQETPEGFSTPDNIVFTSVDPLTGKITEPWARQAIQEVFIAGTEPDTAFGR